jgi:ATP synthase protein I
MEQKRRGNGSRDGGLPARVGRKAERRIKARQSGPRSVWFGMGMFGMVGWTVAVSTLLGVALGVWIDRTWPGRYSWTLTLLFAGLLAGLMNAWYWIRKESRDDENNHG